MSRIDTSKIHPVVVLGGPDDAAHVSKIHVVIVLEPGDDDSVATQTRQGYCYAQTIRRA